MSAPAVEEAGTPPPPVFWDTSGKRPRRILLVTLTLALVILGLAWWLKPPAYVPPDHGSHHQEASFPRSIAPKPDAELPIIGNIKHGVFNRLVEARHKGKLTYLYEPFTGTLLRQAKPWEVNTMDGSLYAIENFGAPNDKQLILTFDDGPSDYTPELLDLLRRNKVHATFFTIGENVSRHPDIARRIVEEGHYLANHTETHNQNFHGTADNQNRAELSDTDRAIQLAANTTTRLWRMPTGAAGPYEIALAQQAGYLHVNFSLDSDDWKFKDNTQPGGPLTNLRRGLTGAGQVVLMHDGGTGHQHRLEMVQQFIDDAKSEGYSFTSLSTILPGSYIPHGQPRSFASETSEVIHSAPQIAIDWVTWSGIWSLIGITMLYLVLAWYNHFVTKWRKRRRKRRQDHRLQQLREEFGENPSGLSSAIVGEFPLVTVLVPAYNEGVLVDATLNGVFASDYPNFEVIAIDDGSTDDTFDRLVAYAQNEPRLRILTQENQGKAAALNHGIANAKGETIVTLDGDTIFEPQTVGELAGHMEDPKVGVVGGHVKVGNRNGFLAWWQSVEYIIGICVTRMAEGAIGAITIAPGACAAWRKEALVLAGGFRDQTRAEDADLTMMIRKLGFKILQDNDAVAWTEAPESISDLLSQRLRWVFGNLQAFWLHRAMFLNPRYGATGFSMAYSMAWMLISLIFWPVIIGMSVIDVIRGDYVSLLEFTALVTVVHLFQTITALLMLKEKPFHLVVMLAYPLVYEPLRAYVLYRSLITIIYGRGKSFKWNKLKRLGSVDLAPVPAKVATR